MRPDTFSNLYKPCDKSVKVVRKEKENRVPEIFQVPVLALVEMVNEQIDYARGKLDSGCSGLEQSGSSAGS
jgi:hypothetical protein